ncbi:SDR family NAD(P)-dependent oxidoreductase [Nocardia goodfellowii]|uniref:NAD(P)-dependent dehydrogenase (Short-subunit alcohol dehydrogenase family) n=1 Tax=Nocardia goodfellowii TaxID=882446 RepID=A0ABS4QMG7_9NOCA|nr:SDR family NAD(P)-dependent oxidoreductase [Nocardia goodfellowii]MBP2192335.1 NAD(P)-dependent dehydrogenase (short-subunit alcohol dehydrogenase family) [Nocardia goodfellowii]
MPNRNPKTVIIAGGTSGMGRATALGRLAHGDRVTVIGSDAGKGAALLEQAADPNLRFIQADLSSVAEVRRVAREIAEVHTAVDAVGLFANRLNPKRRVTADGLEDTFALYYLSRYLLAQYLQPLLDRSSSPVIINVAGVGATAGAVRWDDPQLSRGYSMIRAQLQAGRANDLAGVGYAQLATTTRYVLYHPGFTRTGSKNHPNPMVHNVISTLARFFARPVESAVAPIVEWIDHPPADPLTAIDRGKPVPLSLSTLDPADAVRLRAYTEDLLGTLAAPQQL